MTPTTIKLLIIYFSGMILFTVLYKYQLQKSVPKPQPIPTDSKSHLTKQIWQTSMRYPNEDQLKLMDMWRNTTDWTYNFMTNYEIRDFLMEKFPMIDFDQVYVQKKILAMDLWRYAIIYEKGGYYADSDVERPSEFYDSMNHMAGCNVILGVEADFRHEDDWTGLFARQLQMCQWAFYAAPKHPLMRLVVSRVVREIMYYQDRKKDLRDVDVMEVTGPGIWTDSVQDYLIATAGVDIMEEFKCGPSYKVNDVCILNVNGFAVNMPHSCHKETDADTFILAIHHFHSSWKR